MPTIKKTIEVDVSLTPKELGELFAEMGSDAQAEFFNAVAIFAKDHYPSGSGAFCMQMQYLTDEHDLTIEGRNIMRVIGEYSGL